MTPALRRLLQRSRLARIAAYGILFPVLFPFYFTVAFVKTFPRTALRPFGLSTEHGKIYIGWRDVLPLDEMAAVLDQRRAELRSVST